MTSNLKRLPSSNVAYLIAIAIAVLLIVSFPAAFILLLSRVAIDHDAISPSPSSFQQSSTLLVANGNWSIRNDNQDTNVNAFPSKFEGSRRAADFNFNYTRRQWIRPVKVAPFWSLPFEHDSPNDKNGSNGIHYSGNFRGNKAAVWDARPEYEFYAFGQLFHLVLEHDSQFAHPSLKVTIVYKNFTVQHEPDVNPNGCYYSGVLRNQSNSNVVVSLCNGMTGHIISDSDSYFVEPAEPFNENMDTFLHILYRFDSDSDADADADVEANTDVQDSRYSVVSMHNETITHCELLQNAATATTEHSAFYVDDEEDGQEEDEEDDSEEEDSGGKNYVLSSRRKRSAAVESMENMVELMIAVDDKMLQYHGSELHSYVLRLMSTVNKIYKDKSIGNAIHITVVKLVVLSDRDIVNTQLSNEETALPKTLDNFCRWQQLNNNDPNTGHHDCALLLSREITCNVQNTDKCYNKLGLAQLGTMCQQDCCAIIRDKGLSTAFTIAHELGHLFNMPHDDDEKCSRFNEKGIKKRVMSKQLGKDVHPWKWSSCSRHFLTEFLDSGNDVCLHNDPLKRDIFNSMDTHTHTQQLPGEKYSVDVQCEMTYGKGYKSCSYAGRRNDCASLWCTDNEETNGCHSNGMPPAEGTSCGHLHWCQQGECVPIDRTPQPLDGGWGPWQPFGECSRPCGGGIKRAYRNCDSPSPINGGKFCLGKRVKYQSCNFKECPIGTVDFRAQQCAKFNNNTGTRDVRWVPHYYDAGVRENDKEKCKLYCRRAENTSSHSKVYKLQDKVIDGTTCGPNTYDMCVNGVCMKAGCDHILNSNSVLDNCGICGGDNSTCKKVRKQFGTADALKFGYNRVAIIPAGASNINVQQRSARGSNDDNYLALVDVESGQYVLNGNFSIVRNGRDIDYDGVTVSYSGSDAPVERINTSKPLRKDLWLQVLCVGNLSPPDIVCEYNVPISPEDYFAWRVTDKWSACDKVCDGEQEKIIRCTRKDTSNYVSEESCSGLPKPKAQIKVCNQHCVLKWNAVSQSECSSQCGLGLRSVTFGCFQQFTDINFPPVQLPDVTCRHIEKPSENQTCKGACDTYRWKYEEWQPCNVSCGNGVETRKASCVDELQRIVDDVKCSASEKIVEKHCTRQKCRLWSIGEWSECSVSCGLGRKTRQVRCQQGNRLVQPYLCAADGKPSPSHVESCEMPACEILATATRTSSTGHGDAVLNGATWTTGPWSNCSARCGIGYRTRTVRCDAFDQNLCSASTKPAASQDCTMAECLPSTSTTLRTNHVTSYEWIADDWQPCSASCGEAEKQRTVRCYSIESRMVVDNFNCDSSRMPSVSQRCAQVACSAVDTATAEWKTTEWSRCSSSCGLGVSARNVWCEVNAVQVDEGDCVAAPKPAKTISCDTRNSCQTTTTTSRYRVWRTGKWGQCSRSCDAGLKIRHVVCHDENGNEASDCDSESKPPASSTCNMAPCDSLSAVYRWIISDWTACSVTCGIGFQTRSVQCERLPENASDGTATDGGVGRRLVSSEYCGDHDRPPATLKRECRLNSCPNDYVWVPETWSECDAGCDGRIGRQRRKLACFHRSGRKVKKTFCKFQRKLHRRRKCTSNKCEPSSCAQVKRKFKTYVDREYPLYILGRNISIYCHRMWSDSPAEYLTLTSNADSENYSEFFARQSNDNGGGGSYSNGCLESSVKAGKTSFQKIRLNTTSLEVNTRDWTFSRQVSGFAVPYGEAAAADCYGTLACARGAFSINLKGTGLRVSTSTSWLKTGVNATMKIDFSNENRKVVAKCVGHCASCRPVHTLKLDVLPP